MEILILKLILFIDYCVRKKNITTLMVSRPEHNSFSNGLFCCTKENEILHSLSKEIINLYYLLKHVIGIANKDYKMLPGPTFFPL